MQVKKLRGLKALYLKVEEGENPLEAVARAFEGLDAPFAWVQGIGGFIQAKLGVFTGEGYEVEEVRPRQGYILEVLSLKGNVVKGPDGKPYPHLHAVLSRSAGEVLGGHLLEAEVKPFLEVVIVAASEAEEGLAELFGHRWG